VFKGIKYFALANIAGRCMIAGETIMQALVTV
jgi:hypothetical protein